MFCEIKLGYFNPKYSSIILKYNAPVIKKVTYVSHQTFAFCGQFNCFERNALGVGGSGGQVVKTARTDRAMAVM